MMPPPLASPTNLPLTPASSDAGPPAKERNDEASGSPDFAAVLAMLAGAGPPPSPCPGAGAPGEPHDEPTDAEPTQESSPETQVAALPNGAGGLPPGLSLTRAPGGGTGPDQAAPALSVTLPGPAGPATSGPATSGPATSGPASQASPTSLRDRSEILPPAAPAADPSGPPGAPVADAASHPRPGQPIAGPSSSAQPVVALAHSGENDGPGSMVAALAHGGENDVPGSMVAALAHRGENDGPGSPVAALARSGADGVPPSAVARRGDGDGPGSPRAALAQGAAGAAPPPADRGGLSAGRRPSTAQPARAGQVSTSAVIDADRFLTAGVAAAEVPVGASAEPLSAPSRRLSGATTEVSVLGLHTAGNSSARQAEAVAAPSDAAPPATLPAVADQIVSAVVPLHGRGDGRHEVTLELRPGDLGAIRVEVAVEHQTVHVTLHAVEPATGRLLSAALPELRSALAEAGLTAGHVGVGPDGGGGAGQRRPATGDGAAERSRAGAGHRGGPQNTDPVRTVRPATAGRLDLFL